MDILFVAHWDANKKYNIGVKLQGQVNALERLGHNVTALKFEEGAVWAKTKEKSEKLFDISENGFMHLLAIPKAVNLLLSQGNKYDLCYIRRTFCTPWHLAMLRKLKKNQVLTVEELPTYPYDKESKLFKKSYQVAVSIEKVCRRFYHFWLDYFVTYSEHDFIFHVPTIKIENGIDAQSILWEEHRYEKEAPINLITISSMKPWHGYERLFEGLAAYKIQNEKEASRFTIHMVGDGEMRTEWEELVRKLEIADQVIFYGNKSDDDLNRIVRKCSIAVATLGFYKISRDGELSSSVLKIREYMARGIPFVYSVKEPSIKETESFCMLVPNDESFIDFDTLKEFYNKLRDKEMDGEKISENMRDFAEKNYSWDFQMGKIIHAIDKQQN